MVYLSTLQVQDRGLDIGKRTPDKATKKKKHTEAERSAGKPRRSLRTTSAVGVGPSELSIFKPDGPVSVHPLVGEDSSGT